MKLNREEKQSAIAIFVVLIIATCTMWVMLENGFEKWIPELKSIIIMLYTVIWLLSIFSFYLLVKTMFMTEKETVK